MQTSWASCSARTATDPSAGVCRSAFAIRLASTRSIFSGATTTVTPGLMFAPRLTRRVAASGPRTRSVAETISARSVRRSSSVNAPASIWASSNRSSTRAVSVVAWSRRVGRYSVGLDQAVLGRFDQRPQRRERRAEVVTRPGHELAPRVEELLDRGGHRVERRRERAQLTAPSRGRPGREIAGRDRSRGGAELAKWPCDRACEQQPGHDRRGRRAGRDGEDLHVGAHVEHHPARHQHRGERNADRQEREAGQLQIEPRRARQEPRDGEADREARSRDGDCEPDHGSNL